MTADITLLPKPNPDDELAEVKDQIVALLRYSFFPDQGQDPEEALFSDDPAIIQEEEDLREWEIELGALLTLFAHKIVRLARAEWEWDQQHASGP